MSRGRIYSSAIDRNTGKLILPWVSLVMASLMTATKDKIKAIDIALDLAGQDKFKASIINGMVNTCAKKLENAGFINNLKDGSYKVTAKGHKEFAAVLDRAVQESKWAALSDSKHFG